MEKHVNLVRLKVEAVRLKIEAGTVKRNFLVRN